MVRISVLSGPRRADFIWPSLVDLYSRRIVSREARDRMKRALAIRGLGQQKKRASVRNEDGQKTEDGSSQHVQKSSSVKQCASSSRVGSLNISLYLGQVFGGYRQILSDHLQTGTFIDDDNTIRN